MNKLNQKRRNQDLQRLLKARGLEGLVVGQRQGQLQRVEPEENLVPVEEAEAVVVVEEEMAEASNFAELNRSNCLDSKLVVPTKNSSNLWICTNSPLSVIPFSLF